MTMEKENTLLNNSKEFKTFTNVIDFFKIHFQIANTYIIKFKFKLKQIRQTSKLIFWLRLVGLNKTI